MTERVYDAVVIARTESAWACNRDGCQTPLAIVNRGVRYHPDIPEEVATARKLLDGAIFIHGADADAPARAFTWQDLIDGTQEEWIMACHTEQQGGQRVDGPRRKDLPAPQVQPTRTSADPSPQGRPAPTPDPRQNGPVPDRRVRPQ